MLLWPTVILAMGSIAAAPLGTNLGKVLDTKARGVLTGLIILIAAKIWFDIFGVLS